MTGHPERSEGSGRVNAVFALSDHAGGSPAAFRRRHAPTFLCFAKESNQRKATWVRRFCHAHLPKLAVTKIPCATRSDRPLRNSSGGIRSSLDVGIVAALLKQCSRTSPVAPALLGGCQREFKNSRCHRLHAQARGTKLEMGRKQSHCGLLNSRVPAPTFCKRVGSFPRKLSEAGTAICP